MKKRSLQGKSGNEMNIGEKRGRNGRRTVEEVVERGREDRLVKLYRMHK